MAKTNVKVMLDENDSIRYTITQTVKALRWAGKDKEACEFQRDVVSGRKSVRQVVKDYVILI